MPVQDKCMLCPRNCQALRYLGETGYCGASSKLRVARAALHHWEEPPVSGTKGSGTVFFSNCPLRCAYCQNHLISLGSFGVDISVHKLGGIMHGLAMQGAHNINLVTATQYTDEVVRAVRIARELGLSVPVIWNSSAYETTRTIKLLEDTVDAYIFDYRYDSSELAYKYSAAADYPSVAIEAIAAAYDLVGGYRLDSQGLLASGLIVRFLLLPDQLDEATRCVDKVFSLFGNTVCYSLLGQYTPIVGIGDRFPELGAKVDPWHYDLLIDHVLDLGITHSYMQEEGSDDSSFIPDFDLTGVDG
ncbi:MAG: radical SAM protein [Coriobacteriia bacterium]|nr:radical SAM protein [Coriobacteriia bacterium]